MKNFFQQLQETFFISQNDITNNFSFVMKASFASAGSYR